MPLCNKEVILSAIKNWIWIWEKNLPIHEKVVWKNIAAQIDFGCTYPRCISLSICTAQGKGSYILAMQKKYSKPKSKMFRENFWFQGKLLREHGWIVNFSVPQRYHEQKKLVIKTYKKTLFGWLTKKGPQKVMTQNGWQNQLTLKTFCINNLTHYNWLALD